MKKNKQCSRPMPKKPVRTSVKAGVALSVSRISKMMRRSKVCDRVSSKAPVYVAGLLEPVIKSLLEGARANTDQKKTKRVMKSDVVASVRCDPDLARLFVDFAFGSKAPARKTIDYTLGVPEQKERHTNLARSKEKRELRFADLRAQKSIAND